MTYGKFLFLFVASLSLSTSCFSDDYNWVGASGGLWTDSENWDPNTGTPSFDTDTATIEIPDTDPYVIDLDGISIDIGDVTVDALEAFSSITLDNGQLSFGDFAALTSNTNTPTLTVNASVEMNGGLTVNNVTEISLGAECTITRCRNIEVKVAYRAELLSRMNLQRANVKLSWIF